MSGKGWSNELVVSQPFCESVSLGDQPGTESIILFGLNQNVGTSEVDIWNNTGFYTWQQTAQRVEIFSDDANDTSAGTGARLLLVRGLDVNFNEITDVVVMAGLTSAFTTLLFIRIIFISVVQSGTYGSTAGGANIGTLTMRHEDTTDIIDLMRPEAGVIDAVRYTVPAGKRTLLKIFNFSVSSSKEASIIVHIRLSANVFVAPFGATVHSFELTNSNAIIQLFSLNPFPFPAFTDMWVSAIAGQVNTPVNAAFTLEQHPAV